MHITELRIIALRLAHHSLVHRAIRSLCPVRTGLFLLGCPLHGPPPGANLVPHPLGHIRLDYRSAFLRRLTALCKRDKLDKCRISRRVQNDGIMGQGNTSDRDSQPNTSNISSKCTKNGAVTSAMVSHGCARSLVVHMQPRPTLHEIVLQRRRPVLKHAMTDKLPDPCRREDDPSERYRRRLEYGLIRRPGRWVVVCVRRAQVHECRPREERDLRLVGDNGTNGARARDPQLVSRAHGQLGPGGPDGRAVMDARRMRWTRVQSRRHSLRKRDQGLCSTAGTAS